MALHPRKEQAPADLAVLAEYDTIGGILTADNPLYVCTLESGRDVFNPRGRRIEYHKALEVVVALDQGYRNQVGDCLRKAEPGDVFLMGMHEPHAWEMDSRVRTVVFHFLPTVLEWGATLEPSLLTMFSVPPARRPQVGDAKTRELVISVADDVIGEYERQRPDYLAVCRLHLLRLLAALQRNWMPPEISAALLTARDFERLQPAISLGNARLSEHIAPQEAAAACGLSVSRFYDLFSRAMGVSWADFRRRSRLALAARLLLDTDLSVEAVALQTGFTDRSHLYHRFREHYGLTPAVYRKQAQYAPARVKSNQITPLKP